MRLLVMLTVVGCALTAAAQDFQLRSATGELTGPFRCREGEAIQVGTNIASIVNVRSQENEILDKMQAIRIPEIDFRQANLRDVVAFLSQASVEFSPDRRGISMILKLDEQHSSLPPDTQDSFFSAPTNSVPDSAPTIPTVTFSALDITLKEALDYTCDITGYKYRIRNGGILLLPRNTPDGPIVVRTYDVLPSSTHRLQELGSAVRQNQQGGFVEIGTTGERNQYEFDLKSFFAEMGVPWPTGSYIKHVRGIGKLIVANTEENLAIFEDVLSILNVQPYQIEIELAFLACDRQQILALGPDGVTTAALMALWTSGEAELMAAPRVVTQSGQAATIKGCSEYIYPTLFEVCSIGGATNTNSTATANAFMIEPQDFATREVGYILEVTPEISPEGNLINLCLSPEFVEPPVWEQFGGPFLDADGKTHQTNMPQPYFHTYKETSNVLVANGKRILVGGGLPSRDGQRLIYMLLTARKVGTDGEPLR